MSAKVKGAINLENWYINVGFWPYIPPKFSTVYFKARGTNKYKYTDTVFCIGTFDAN